MNNYLRAALPVAALIFTVPAANAWNLVNSINADARQMPGAPATTVVGARAGVFSKTVVLIQIFM